MKYLLRIVLLLLISSLNSFSITPVEKYGALQVIGKNLCDSAGNPIQLRGISTHGIQYFEYFYDNDVFNSLANDWNVDVVRIANYVNEGWFDNGMYIENPDFWKSKVDTLVGYAIEYGLYVLIDWHMLVSGDPNYFLTESKEFWAYMVSEHGHKKNVIFEICNEPNDDSTHYFDGVNYQTVPHTNPVTWIEHIKPYAEEIVPIIRSYSDNVIIVGTEFWAQRPDLIIGNELNYENVMYTAHFYAADHKEGVLQNVRTAIENDIPVFITEFGTQSADGDQANDFLSSNKWLDFLDSNRVSWINWNFSNDHRSGAIFEEWFEGWSVEDYSDTTNMKEAGRWIYNRLNKEPIAISNKALIKSCKTETIIKNYSSGNLHISMEFNKNAKLSIYNISGRRIISRNLNEKIIHIGNLSRGIYTIRIEGTGFNINERLTLY